MQVGTAPEYVYLYMCMCVCMCMCGWWMACMQRRLNRQGLSRWHATRQTAWDKRRQASATTKDLSNELVTCISLICLTRNKTIKRCRATLRHTELTADCSYNCYCSCCCSWRLQCVKWVSDAANERAGVKCHIYSYFICGVKLCHQLAKSNALRGTTMLRLHAKDVAQPHPIDTNRILIITFAHTRTQPGGAHVATL